MFNNINTDDLSTNVHPTLFSPPDAKLMLCGRAFVKRIKYKIMFNNGNQTPAYGNEKTASKMIIDLQDKNAKLRLGLGKLLQLCKNTKMNQQDEVWNHYMGLAQQMMDETDPNGKWSGIRL